MPGGSFTPPLTEDMVNNLPPSYAKTVVYPAYRELLNAASKGKKWTWCEVCPDAIVSLSFINSSISVANANQDWIHPQWLPVQLSPPLGPVPVPLRREPRRRTK